ncbi:MAG: tyrosine-type recombinase/integrase, partial [Chitinophagales bacterium]|nr:tyrosine-type recombinase/integrase [Chitinophagales bacterium]
MDWHSTIKGFRAYLQLERSLSPNSIDGYQHDVKLLHQFFELNNNHVQPEAVSQSDLQAFIEYINETGLSDHTHARILSGIRSFYKYLMMEDLVKNDPTLLIEGPKLRRKLPDTLNVNEINLLMQAIDHSRADGMRNRAIIETLYGCGLRVSELVELKISNLYFDVGFIKVIGKGNKERLVPIGESAIKHIEFYREGIRNHVPINTGHEDFLFLNRRGRKLTRVYVFMMIKELALKIGLKKSISPHTFRHSF